MLLSESKSVAIQIFYTCSAAFSGIPIGSMVSWTSSAIPQMMSGELGFTITSDEGSWIVSSTAIGGVVSTICVRFIMDRIGKRRTLIIGALPHVLCWVIIKFSTEAWHFYVARFLCGVAFGFSTAAVIPYVGEISDRRIRGGLLSLVRFILNLGYVVGYVVGGFFSYITAIYIHLCISCIEVFIISIFVLESPYFFIKNGDKNEAERTLMKQRATKVSKDVRAELELIEITVAKDMENKSSFKEIFTNSVNRKSLLIIAALKVFTSSSGYFVIASYLRTILERAGIELSVSLVSILYSIMQCFFVLMTSIIVDKVGRKPLLIISFTGLSTALLALGGFFFVQEYLKVGEEVLQMMNWLPLTCIVLFCFSFNTGIGPMVYVLEGEAFKTNVKVPSITFCNVLGSLVSVLATKGFQMGSDKWGTFVPFWIMGSIMVVAIVFTVIMVPETKRKTFLEIQDALAKNTTA